MHGSTQISSYVWIKLNTYPADLAYNNPHMTLDKVISP